MTNCSQRWKERRWRSTSTGTPGLSGLVYFLHSELWRKSFRLLPTKKEANGEWNARSWSKTRKGWVFITSRPTERNTLRPLHSLWIDLLVMRLMNEPAPNQRKVWFVIDELASLQRLPQLHTALTEARKSKNPMVLGFQGRAQLQAIYGDKLAEVMVSQPATKLFMKTAEPNAAQWISKAIGYVEIERVKETKHDGAKQGRNYSLDRQIEPLVMESQIAGLDDLHAYLKHGNNVAQFNFNYISLPKVSPGFVSRTGAEGELSFDPDTLKPRPPKPGAASKQAGAAAAPATPSAGSKAPPEKAEIVETEVAETVAPASGGEVGTEATEHRKSRKSRKKSQQQEAQPEPETEAEILQEECLSRELDRPKAGPEKQQISTNSYKCRGTTPLKCSQFHLRSTPDKPPRTTSSTTLPRPRATTSRRGSEGRMERWAGSFAWTFGRGQLARLQPACRRAAPGNR